MRLRSPIALALALVAAACGGDGGSDTTSGDADPTVVSNTTSSDGPIVLGFDLDGDSAEAMVTFEEGGTVVATASDGTVFELVVAPGSVAEETVLRLSPVSNLEGFGTGLAFAVRLEPEGLELFELARLTVTPATPIPVEEQLAFVAASDGTGVEMALLDPVADSIVLLLEHFSIGGVMAVTPQQRAIFLQKSATNSERRIGGEIRERIRAERDRQLSGASESDGNPDLDELVDEWEREVVDKRREAAQVSCSGLTTYLRTVVGFERDLQLLGLSEAEEAASNARVAAAIEFVSTRYPECEQEAIAACRADQDPAILVRFWLANERPADQTQAEQICDPQGYQFQFSGSGTASFAWGSTSITWSYFGLLCPDSEEWRVWEDVDISGVGEEHTGPPGNDPYGPLFVTFDEGGAMIGAVFPPIGQSPPGFLLHGTRLTLSPGDRPTMVNAVIAAGQINITVNSPVVPYDGSFAECPADGGG